MLCYTSLYCYTFVAQWSSVEYMIGKSVGQGNVVGIATRYGLDRPGIESHSGVRFSTPVLTGPWDHPATCTIGTGCLFRW
jgi:hypothetical protein